MPWYVWVTVAVLVLASLTTVTAIGKPRQPLTPAVAVGVLVTNGLIVWALIAAGSR